MDLSSRNKISPDFSMSSMTDIVFLLLIFFMLTSTMVSTNVLDLTLPQADGNAVGSNPIVISIDNDSHYFLGKEPILKENLAKTLAQALADKTEKSFIVQAEENTATKEVVYVMDIANKNQYKMALATKPNQE
ncbi:biopolymer transport protein ExbD [Candidatus Ornithobacterium hominis]|uniref:Biopolymer transport protein ExbD n=1 Tax=Candidatus Ornithobacterium hominis TaxID=2497989 RepID=A0A383U328_9FLAO|nr:biopolymer transporter ExbD [Candidatus Ornithobacterium hominis]MCT7905172.1 biopolymer transporter ExbD [Candidatus Ornithobacterium hominis]CAI9429141.1 Biopolymer transport protein ExbD [Candidatus Ornithobacterium hominis]SZD74245.1 biopolymer transport protein ExbD [Candidatus Ornithobacterium hominis]